MSDAVVEQAAPAQAIPKKSKATKSSGEPKAKPTHPKTADMVVAAVKSLKERNGSSLQAIKKYIMINYKVDMEKSAPFIKRYVKAAVASGVLVQTKGTGASGSFKLPSADQPEKKKPKVRKSAVKPAKPVAKKLKKAATPKKVEPAKKTEEAKEKSPEKLKPVPKSPKAKKSKGMPTKKPKTPKPKKAAVKPKTGAKN